MEFAHRPVMLEPTVDALLQADFSGRGARRPAGRQKEGPDRTDGIYVDATFGRGGHCRELLSRLGERARVVAFDKDPQAIEVAQALALQDPRLSVVHGGFAGMTDALAALGIEQIDGVMMDLGISSPQIDDARRGFSFMREGPLDMRMDTTAGQSAAEWLTEVSVDELREVISNYGEERFAFQIAKAVAARRAVRPLLTTLELAELVASAVRTREKGQHPATRTFQAIRIHINRELEELPVALASALTLLAPGGRMSVISFHSLEDRLVKRFIARAARPDQGDVRLPLRESELPPPLLWNLGKVVAQDDEVAGNPRSRSAILRAAERTPAPLSDAMLRSLTGGEG